MEGPAPSRVFQPETEGTPLKSTCFPLATVLLALIPLPPSHAADLKDWKVEGDVTLDTSRSHTEKGSSIKVGPGGRAVKTLRQENGSGHVTLWIFDDKTSAADPKAPRVGPSWGVIQPDGNALVVGILYAAYLSGDSGYTSGDGKGEYFRKCQWLSTPREARWRKWDFNFNPEKGMTLSVDDKPYAVKQFDWNKTNIAGFSGIVLIGDEAKGAKQQTLWVDDVQAELGGAMVAKPTPPPPPPPFLPAEDPVAEGEPVKLLDGVAGKHPRLLISADRIPKLREYYNSENAKPYREQMLAYLPGCGVPENRKTSTAWGQEHGLFKMPMLALHYVLTGDKDSFARSVAYLKWLAGTANWTEGGEPAVEDTPAAYAKVLEKMKQIPPGGETNSDTTAAFTMVGAALTWDWLYNDLDPAFREQFREILWQHARVMYYGGHLAGNPGGNYWRDVPMYNHRWFRDWGMSLAALAATEGKPEDQWFLGKIRGELKFMADVLPTDGSQHEGPGYGSSSGALGITFQVSDECLGTKHLEVPFFRNVAMFAMQESAPGMEDAFYFSDCFTKARSVHPFYLKTAAHAKQLDQLDGIRQYLKAAESMFGVRDYAWLALLSDDPAQQGGQFSRLPTTYLFPDLGLAILRETWTPQSVAAMFKCGPPGGYRLNAWRETAKTAEGKLPYINVAHDQPEANTFTLFADGDFVAETDRYPLNPGKLSTGHNTILINGIGQIPQGRAEGEAWWQPSSNDMTKMGVITAWKDSGEVVVIEGEASGSYCAYTDRKTKATRPDLDRYRRAFIWVKGSYVLILDDVRSPSPVDVTWLIQGAKLETVDGAEGRYRLSKNKAQCEFQLVADSPLQAKMGVSTANDHNKLLNWQQLQAGTNAAAVHFASIYDPWHHNDLRVKLVPEGKDKVTVTVTGKGISDTWEWQAGAGKFEAGTIRGARQGGFNVVVDAKTAAPPAP